MKAATPIGILVATIGVLGGAMMEGTSPMALLNIPAIMIVLIGTLGATIASVGLVEIKKVPKLYMTTFSPPSHDPAAVVRELVSHADRARRDGLLALESEIESIEDEFTRKGLQLVVDGTDPELVREILEAEIDGTAARHKTAAASFEKAGGYAPTMGIIGTVFSLVHVLQNLDQPETLGPMISGAFIATLLGVASANMVFLPMHVRLKGLSEEEQEARSMALEGILAIQAGDNPRIVAEKLISYVPPADRDAARETNKPDLRAVEDAAQAA